MAENNLVASPSEVIVEVHKPPATLSGVPREESQETVQGKSAGSFPEQRLVIKPRTYSCLTAKEENTGESNQVVSKLTATPGGYSREFWIGVCREGS